MVEAVAKKNDPREGYLAPLPGQAFKVQQDLSKLLRESKCDSQMRNLYDHIVEVVDRLVQSCPDKAIECFEEVSYLIKRGDSVKLEEFIKTVDSRDYSVHCDQTAAGTQETINRLKGLFKAPAQDDDAGGNEDGGQQAIANV